MKKESYPYEPYICKSGEYKGSTPTVGIKSREFFKKYSIDDYRIPAIISVFAQESASINSGKYIKSLNREIEKVKKELTNTPLYFIIQCKNQAEKAIAQHLINKKHNVIIIGDTPDCPISGYDRYICDSNPEKVMVESGWMMFAFWDGKRGGSVDAKRVESAVVRMLKGDSEKRTENGKYKMSFPSTAAIVHFLLEREDIPHLEEFKARYLYTHYAENGTEWFYVTPEEYSSEKFAEGGEKAKLKRNFVKEQNKSLSMFNKGLAKHKISRKNTVDDLLPGLFKDNERINDSRARFAFYDNFAVKNQKRRSCQSTVLIALTVIALMIFGVFADMYNHWTLLAAYAILFILVYIIFGFINKSYSHEYYIFARVLAEAVRAQTYWYSIGLDKSVRCDYPISHRDKLGWLYLAINALHTVNRSIGGEIGTVADSDELKDIKAFWIGEEEYNDTTRESKIFDIGQYRYFDNGINKKTKSNNKSQSIVKWVSILSLIITLALVFVVCGVHLIKLLSLSSDTISLTENISLFVLGILPIIMAAATTGATIRSFKEEVNRHKWCKIMTQRALADLETLDFTASIFEEYGNQAIDENGDWAIMKLDRRPEIIKN